LWERALLVAATAVRAHVPGTVSTHVAQKVHSQPELEHPADVTTTA
jgi:hypothetical protein